MRADLTNRCPDRNVLGLSDLPNAASLDFYYEYGSRPTDGEYEPNEWEVLLMRIKELFVYILDKLTMKLNQPLKDQSAQPQTLGEMIYESSLYMDGE